MTDGETPIGAVVVVRQADGSEQDVTTSVQALYDLVISSMDWGSEFWSFEDAVPVGEIAQLCGFERIEEVERYLAAAKKSEEAKQARARELDAAIRRAQSRGAQ